MDNNSHKQARKNLSLTERYNILQRLDNGESGTKLAAEFKVSKQAISSIKKKKSNISKNKNTLDSCDGNVAKKRYRGTEETLFEQKLYIWFKQQRSLGFPISGPIIQKKALVFNKQLGGSEKFKASDGWLDRFKKRHGIRHLSIQGEKLSANPIAGQKFKEKMTNIMSVTGIGPEYIYNCDETALYWKMMPDKSLVCKSEKRAEGRKKPKNRITVMLCCNASGSHKIKLLLIGKSMKPRCFRGVKNLPVAYASQENAWMNREIMTDWYENIFIPEVTNKYDLENNKDIRILLIMDNASCHPPEAELNSICDFSTVIFLPPNVTSLIQPLDQGIIEKFERCYKHFFLTRLLAEHDPGAVEKYLKELDLLDCSNLCALSWNEVTADNIKNCWKNTISFNDEPTSTAGIETIDTTAFHSLIMKIPQLQLLTLQDTDDWLNRDSNEICCRYLTDEEILNNRFPDCNDENAVHNLFDERSSEYEETTSETNNNIISVKDAYNGFKIFYEWYQRFQGNSVATIEVLQKCNKILLEHIVV